MTAFVATTRNALLRREQEARMKCQGAAEVEHRQVRDGESLRLVPVAGGPGPGTPSEPSHF
jgi:hypothetical protein